MAYLFANTGCIRHGRALQPLPGDARTTPSANCRGCAPGSRAGQPAANYLLALLTGTLWYGQFFFYNLGHVRLGKHYAFTSWAIHMIMLVLFSNLVAIVFKEWKGCRGRTKTAIGLGLVVLCAAVLLLTYGNYLGEQTPK